MQLARHCARCWACCRARWPRGGWRRAPASVAGSGRAGVSKKETHHAARLGQLHAGNSGRSARYGLEGIGPENHGNGSWTRPGPLARSGGVGLLDKKKRRGCSQASPRTGPVRIQPKRKGTKPNLSPTGRQLNLTPKPHGHSHHTGGLPGLGAHKNRPRKRHPPLRQAV